MSPNNPDDGEDDPEHATPDDHRPGEPGEPDGEPAAQPGDDQTNPGDEAPADESEPERPDQDDPLGDIAGSYRDRSQPEDSTGPPTQPDPYEPLDLDFDDEPQTPDQAAGETIDLDAPSVSNATSDTNGADAIPEEFDLDEPAGAGQSTAAWSSPAGESRRRVLGTSLESPVSSDAILDQVERPAELSGVERVAEGVVDVADQVDSDRAHTTSRLDRYAYRRFGPLVRAHADRFADYRETVNKARLEETYDEYLARVTLWTALFSIAGALVGMTTATALVAAGAHTALTLNIPVPGWLVPVLDALRIPTIYAGSILATAATFGALVATTMYSYPGRRAAQRRREIEHLLPQTVTYMYALSQGQLSIPAIIRQVAGDDDTYGEVAREFQAVVNEMDFRGRDLRAALRAARDATPSEELGILFDDMINVESTGGTLSPFFKEKVDTYQYEARRQKRQYLDTLEQFAELYVTVAASMVFIITMAAIYVSITGAGSILLALFLYLALPLLSVGGYAMIDAVSLRSLATTATLRTTHDDRLTVADLTNRLTTTAPTPPDRPLRSDGGSHTTTTVPSMQSASRMYSRTAWSDEELSPIERSRLSALRNALRRRRVITTLTAPLRRIHRQPLVSLVFTIPLSLVYLLAITLGGIVTVSPSAFATLPAWTTTATVVVPLVIMLAPVSYFHYWERRRRAKANAQLPGLLRKLAAATDSGATLSEAIAIVAASTDTYLARELERVHIESAIWNLPRHEALIRMTDRVRNPRLARVVQLVIEAAGSTDYLRDILDIAATDVRNAHRLEQDRQADMQKYMYLIVAANLTFLIIATIIAVFIIPRMAVSTTASQDIVTQAGGQASTLLFGDTPPTSLIQMFFMHGAIILALTSGLLAGKIGYDDLLAGTPIALGKLVLISGVFLLL